MCSTLRATRSSVRLVIGLLLAVLLPGVAAAQPYLVDTGSAGTNSIGSYGLFGASATNCSPQPTCGLNFQFLAARIVLPQAATVTGVDLWVVPFSFGGSMNVRIREEANGLPAANAPPLFSANSIYARTYTGIPNYFGSPAWVNFGGFEAVLAAGTYWITFEPVAGTNLNFSVPSGAPSPLTKYAYYTNGNPGYLNLPGSLGVRVSGTTFDGIAFGTATRMTATGGYECCVSINQDFVQEGQRDFTWLNNQGPALTSTYIFDIGAAQVHARGRLVENGLSAGAYAGTNSLTTAAARGIAYRTFVNLGATARTFRVNALLDGSFGVNGGVARAGIYAFDTTKFSQRLQLAAPVTPGHVLLDADGYNEIRDTLYDQSISLARFFTPDTLLGIDLKRASWAPGQIQAIPMQTGLLTLQPGGTLTVLFDIAVSAGLGGGVNFGDTLKPAAVLLTDSGGNAVYDVVAVGPAAPAALAVAALAASPAASNTPIGSARSITILATKNGGGVVAGAPVSVQIVSGPNAGAAVPLVTDANGEATYTYVGTTLGTDIFAIGSGAVTAAPVTTTWVTGTPHHLTLTPATATVDVGTSQAYTVAAFDVLDNPLGDVTASAAFSIAPDGTCFASSCTPSLPGPHTVTASDSGKSAQASLTAQAITGGFTFNGFFAPVDSMPVENVMKAGAAVPVKFSLGGNFGLAILAGGSPLSRPVACNTGAPQDTVDQTSTAGASGLSYDVTTGRYSYVWKTEKGWAGSCRQFEFTLTDGSAHAARFRFR